MPREGCSLQLNLHSPCGWTSNLNSGAAQQTTESRLFYVCCCQFHWEVVRCELRNWCRFSDKFVICSFWNFCCLQNRKHTHIHTHIHTFTQTNQSLRAEHARAVAAGPHHRMARSGIGLNTVPWRLLAGVCVVVLRRE